GLRYGADQDPARKWNSHFHSIHGRCLRSILNGNASLNILWSNLNSLSRGRRTIDMALSAHFGESIKTQYLEHDSLSEEKNSGCVLANLLSQSLSLYVELEKTHWHLRLNPAGEAVDFEGEGPTEIAREVCTNSLRL